MSARLSAANPFRPVGAAEEVGEVLAAQLAPGVDPLADVLLRVRLKGALLFMVDATSPWGVEVPPAGDFASIILPGAQHVISYHVVLSGGGWASIPGIGSLQFQAGDILVIPHADPYVMTGAPGQRPAIDAKVTIQFLEDMASGKLPFVIREGGGGPERAQFLCGYLGCDVRPFNPLLKHLPRLMRIKWPDGQGHSLLESLVALTLAEARVNRAGSACTRIGLSELMFVEAVRHYFETLPAEQGGWLAGLRDPAVGRALTLLHDRPSHPWTLEELASQSGMSRASLAKRFAETVGCPPMWYLKLWRLQIAAQILSDGPTKVAAVAHEVGYESEAHFSRAFKKATGLPPSEWRKRVVVHRSK